jgi:Ca2+-binding RTX toxin-like protein
MASVTVPGAGPTGFNTGAVSEIFGNSNNALLAQQISNAIAFAGPGHVNVMEPVFGVPPAPPATKAGDINELLITAGGSYNIPAGSAGHADYVVILDIQDSKAVTIVGGPNTTVWGGGAQVTIVDPATTTVAESAGNATVTLTAADVGAVVAGNNQNDTLSAGGANDTIFAGTGNNLLSASATGDVLVGNTGSNTFNVSGTSDTIMAGAGTAEVNASGSAAQIFGGSGAMTLVTTGSCRRHQWYLFHGSRWRAGIREHWRRRHCVRRRWFPECVRQLRRDAWLR